MEGAAWESQAKHFLDWINRSESKKADLRKQRDDLAQENDLKEELRDLRRQQSRQPTSPSPLGELEPRHQSIVTASTTAASSQRTPKYRHPPTLTDGVDPTYEEWEEGLKDKLHMNADWYDVDERRAHANRVMIYVKSTVQGKAFDHLIAYLKQFDKNETVTVEMCRQYLKRAFDDPDKRMKAREELHKLKLNYLGDFGAFYSEFVRLANISRKAKDFWKEDIHDKLYASLRTHMELFVVDDGCDFETYCQKAQHFARGLGREGQARREAREAAAKKMQSK